MRRVCLISVAALALAACQSGVPQSNPGVGFGDYTQYAQAQQSAAQGMAAAPTTPLTAPGQISTGAIGAGDLAAAGIGAAPPLQPGAAPPVQATPSNPAPLQIQSSGISDEQDFEAVAARETIQSDAERLAQAAANYQVVQPTALPSQPQDTGPNIVAYALNAPNRLGQPWYSRFILSGQGRFERNCASYRSPDEAQRDFMLRGGPDRDPRGLDPDGDGFACGWDPGAVPGGCRPLQLISERLSPNCGERRGGARPDLVVIHYTGMASAAEAADRLCDPAAEVSAHYLIAEDGHVLRLVPEDLRAWHAGAGRWGAVTDINSRSIGIELHNRGDRPFPAAQMRALAAVLKGIRARWPIGPERVIGHSDMAPLRKRDPGPLFAWRWLARQGLSVWPAAGAASRIDGRPSMAGFRAAARVFGYDPGLPDAVLLGAFRLRFRAGASGPLAPADLGMIADLARRWPVDRGPAED